MRLNVILEFLISGFLLVFGLMACIDSLSEDNAVLTFLKTILMSGQEARLPEGTAIALGILFLGFCYAAGTFSSVLVYDLFQRPRMQAKMQTLLDHNPTLAAAAAALPSNIKTPEEDIFFTIDSFIDVYALEASKDTRALETSLQRLARGSFFGLALMLVASLIYIYRNVCYNVPYVLGSIIVVGAIGGLLFGAVRQYRGSVDDEVEYVARIFLIANAMSGRDRQR